MKAGWTDSAYYRKKGRRRPSRKWLLPVILGCAISAAALYVGVSNPSLKMQLLALGQPPLVHSDPISAAPVRTLPDNPVSRQAASETQNRFWNNVNGQKQTSFNDSNYQPRGAINVYSAPPVQQLAYGAPAAQPARAMTRQLHSANWYWENGARKQRTRGVFQWVDVNGSIEWGSVCRNYRSGSIEYRDCRKGAKVAFREMCGSYRPACMAENGFRP